MRSEVYNIKTHYTEPTELIMDESFKTIASCKRWWRQNIHPLPVGTRVDTNKAHCLRYILNKFGKFSRHDDPVKQLKEPLTVQYFMIEPGHIAIHYVCPRAYFDDGSTCTYGMNDLKTSLSVSDRHRLKKKQREAILEQILDWKSANPCPGNPKDYDVDHNPRFTDFLSERGMLDSEDFCTLAKLHKYYYIGGRHDHSLQWIEKSEHRKKSAQEIRANNKKIVRKNLPDANRLLGFGKYKNLTYAQVVKKDPSYAKWCSNVDNPKGKMVRFIRYYKNL